MTNDDARYTSLDYSSGPNSQNEYTVQSNSAVYKKLTSLSLYDTYVPDATQMKKNFEYDLYQRRMISWKIACETDQFPTKQ